MLGKKTLVIHMILIALTVFYFLRIIINNNKNYYKTMLNDLTISIKNLKNVVNIRDGKLLINRQHYRMKIMEFII